MASSEDKSFTPDFLRRLFTFLKDKFVTKERFGYYAWVQAPKISLGSGEYAEIILDGLSFRLTHTNSTTSWRHDVINNTGGTINYYAYGLRVITTSTVSTVLVSGTIANGATQNIQPATASATRTWYHTYMCNYDTTILYEVEGFCTLPSNTVLWRARRMI
jgi:hypothetical protein